jgi:hypothetical protein
MTREEKVRENWELVAATESFFDVNDENAINKIIRTHCPGDSIFEEIFSESELGECQLNCAQQEGLTIQACCAIHWKGGI